MKKKKIINTKRKMIGIINNIILNDHQFQIRKHNKTGGGNILTLLIFQTIQPTNCYYTRFRRVIPTYKHIYAINDRLS